MATAKQLAALKKGREAMAKKRAAGKPVAKRSTAAKKKKVSIKKTVPNKFLVRITIRKNNGVGYLVSGLKFDTDIYTAKKMSKEMAIKEADRVFNLLGKQRSDFKQIEVVTAPKH